MAQNEGVQLPAPGSSAAPNYWLHETGGELRAAMLRYLMDAGRLTEREIAWIRAYLRQWIASPVWDRDPHRTASSIRVLAKLRADVDGLVTVEAIRAWIDTATEFGMDPL